MMKSPETGSSFRRLCQWRWRLGRRMLKAYAQVPTTQQMKKLKSLSATKKMSLRKVRSLKLLQSNQRPLWRRWHKISVPLFWESSAKRRCQTSKKQSPREQNFLWLSNPIVAVREKAFSSRTTWTTSPRMISTLFSNTCRTLIYWTVLSLTFACTFLSSVASHWRFFCTRRVSLDLLHKNSSHSMPKVIRTTSITSSCTSRTTPSTKRANSFGQLRAFMMILGTNELWQKYWKD